jgi:hypothetical protein
VCLLRGTNWVVRYGTPYEFYICVLQLGGFVSSPGWLMCDFSLIECYWDSFLSEYHGLSLSLPFHECSLLIFMFTLTFSKQTVSE